MKTLILSLALGMPALATASYDRDLDKRRVEVIDTDGRTWKLARVTAETQVNATPEAAWAALAKYGDVQDVHPAITESYTISLPEVAVGSERFCRIQNGNRVVEIEERIEQIDPGSWYQYDVYKWENFPLKKMNNVFGVRTDEAGDTWVYNVIDYKLKPAMMTGLVRGTMKKNAEGAVLGYKHFIETGEGSVPIDELRERYAAR